SLNLAGIRRYLWSGLSLIQHCVPYLAAYLFHCLAQRYAIQRPRKPAETCSYEFAISTSYRGVGEVDIDAALFKNADDLFLANTPSFPTKAEGLHTDSGFSKRIDDLTAIPVWLADKRHIVLEGQIKLAIEQVITCPLTF